MRDSRKRLRLKNMVHAFANTPHSIGNDSIQFWMFEMERYYKKLEEPVDISSFSQSYYKLARKFFMTRDTDYWPEDVKWTFVDGIYRIKSFR